MVVYGLQTRHTSGGNNRMTERYECPDEAYANYLADKDHTEEIKWQESAAAEAQVMAENEQNKRPLSEQLDENTLHGKIRLYYQADLIISKQDFDKFVEQTMQTEYTDDKEHVTKLCLEMLSDDIKISHPFVIRIESPKIFITEPMPTSDDFSI